MSVCHQKRKTRRAGGMTPPLLLDDPAQFQKILRVWASKNCHGDSRAVPPAPRAESVACPFAAKPRVNTTVFEI